MIRYSRSCHKFKPSSIMGVIAAATWRKTLKLRPLSTASTVTLLPPGRALKLIRSVRKRKSSIRKQTLHLNPSWRSRESKRLSLRKRIDWIKSKIRPALMKTPMSQRTKMIRSKSRRNIRETTSNKQSKNAIKEIMISLTNYATPGRRNLMN